MAARSSQPPTGAATQEAKRAKYIVVFKVDIPLEKEAEFNELYNREHFPSLLTVPGVLGGARYVTEESGQPRYMTIYDLESPDVPDSEEWKKTARHEGLWSTRVRPYIENVTRTTYRLIYPEG